MPCKESNISDIACISPVDSAPINSVVNADKASLPKFVSIESESWVNNNF